MGCGTSMTLAQKQIELQIKVEERVQRRTLKLLLIGSGESGKSTFMKQMRLLYNQSFTKTEVEGFCVAMHNNMIETMDTLLRCMQKIGIDMERLNSLGSVEIVHKAAMFGQNESMANNVILGALAHLWSIPQIKRFYDSYKDELAIADNIDYFFNNINRLLVPDFTPTEQDLVNTRIQTTGVNEVIIRLKGEMRLRVIDMGGQRSERRKWIRCFDDVTAVLFVTSLAEYNMNLREDESQNKLRSVPLKTTFPDYRGKNEYDECASYLKEKFLASAKDRSHIFYHETCATDGTQVRSVIEAVVHSIMVLYLDNAGLV